MTKEKYSIFERHPVLTIVFINLFFIFSWLSIDIIYSNFISSFTHTYEILKSFKPVGHTNVTNKTFRWESRYGDYNTEVTLNNLGFRNNKDINENTLKGKKVLLAIGDSTTAAFENNYNASYPKVLNDILGDDTIVLNTGVRGFDTNQVIINYQTQLRYLKPNAIIYMICENDIDGNVNPELYPKIMRYYGKGIVNTKDKTITFIEPVKGLQKLKIDLQTFLAKNFQLSFENIYQPLIKLLTIQHTTDLTQEDHFDPTKLKKLQDLLIILNNLSQEDEIPLFITWFPYLTKGNEQNTPIPQYYEKTKSFIDKKLKNTFFIPTYEPLIEYYQKHPSSKETEFLLPHDNHASDFGSKKLGEIIGISIKKIGWE